MGRFDGPEGGTDGRMDGWTVGRKIFPFYRTSFPIGAVDLPPPRKEEQGKGCLWATNYFLGRKQFLSITIENETPVWPWLAVSEAWLAVPEPWLADRWTYRQWTYDGQTGGWKDVDNFFPILIDIVLYRRRCPKREKEERRNQK